MALPYGLRALRHRDYRLFWVGQLVSRVGTWMQSVAQSWLVLELTNSPLRLGLISTLQFSPVLLFAFLGGVVSDRVRKRRLIIATQVAMMFQALALAALVWSGHVQYWHVALKAGMSDTPRLGFVSASPSTNVSFSPERPPLMETPFTSP